MPAYRASAVLGLTTLFWSLGCSAHDESGSREPPRFGGGTSVGGGAGSRSSAGGGAGIAGSVGGGAGSSAGTGWSPAGAGGTGSGGAGAGGTGAGGTGSCGYAASTVFVPYAPTADSDPFYAAPDPLPCVPPGTILSSRTVTFSPSPQNPAWQLQYMSKDVNGNPQAAIATVVKPIVAASTTPVPLLSYQFAEDSLGNKCAPSHQLTGGSGQLTTQIEGLQYLGGLQTHGWALVFPDHQGPYSQYATGRLAAQITLDGIRAAESFAPLGLSGARTPVGMWGYSGGALATAWAAQLHPDYAPELNIVGVASGGTPTDLVAAAKSFDTGLGNSLFFLGFSAVFGVSRAYPELFPESLLNDRGRSAIARTKDGCVGQTTDGSPVPIGHFADYVTVPDPFNTPGVLETAPKITLPQPGRVPTSHMYVYHAVADELVPVAGADAMVDAYCEAGAKIGYNRILVGGHIVVAATGAVGAANYLVSRFAGNATPAMPLGTRTCN